MLLREVERVLKSHGVARQGGDGVLVACSGGADSIALAHACATLLGGRRVVVGHVDHGVRAGSEADAAFVVGFAETMKLEVRVVRLPPGPSSEARLRKARYEALESMRAACGAAYVLTAHTRNDQAETVLLALVRSGRPTTLRGIPVRRGRILRPLLRVTREEVRGYGDAHRLPWREDPTNREPTYLRNRIRKELLPLLDRRYRGRTVRRLARLARGMAALGRGRAKTSRSKTETPGPRATPSFVWAMEKRPWTGGALPDGRSAALFDADALGTPRVRRVAPGDRIVPFGMDGHRKLTDVMREAGIPPKARPEMTIVVNAAGDVVWVPGLARSNEALVGPLTHSVWAFWIVKNEDAQLQAAASGVSLEPPQEEE